MKSTCDVRFGSKADIRGRPQHVRFTPESRSQRSDLMERQSSTVALVRAPLVIAIPLAFRRAGGPQTLVPLFVTNLNQSLPLVEGDAFAKMTKHDLQVGKLVE